MPCGPYKPWFYDADGGKFATLRRHRKCLIDRIGRAGLMLPGRTLTHSSRRAARPHGSLTLPLLR
jgi:hypothetical protein